MNFASDNATGASPKVMDAIVAANAGAAMPYGADPWTAAAGKAFNELFQRECAVFLVATGTAANALALASLSPPWGAIFCHEHAHIANDECGAPEFFSHGAKLVGLRGPRGKIPAAALDAALRAWPRGLVKQVQPAALSLTQATESGTLYSIAEIAELSAMAHAAGMAVHMDGARFANALIENPATPAEMTWKCGVDVLSFGASKNGTLCCEAVIFFDPSKANDFAFRRKRAGQTLSKGRLLGAQAVAHLADGHWLEMARLANARAARLADGLTKLAGVRLPWEREINEVFAILPRSLDAALRSAGARYYDWGARGLEAGEALASDEVFVRLVASFATTEAEVDALLAVARTA